MSDIEQSRKPPNNTIPHTEVENDASDDRSKFLVFFTAFFITILTSSLFLIYFLQQEPIAVLSVSAISNQQIKGFECDYAEAQKFEPFAGGILKVSMDNVTYMTLAGVEIYSFPISLQNPKCVVEGDYAVVYEQSGFTSFLFDRKGRVYQNRLKESISSIAISDRGFVAYITYQENTKGAVILADKTGNEFGRFESNESGFPINASFSPNGDMFSIVFANTDAATVHPLIKQFQIKNANGAYLIEQKANIAPEMNSVLMQISYSGNRRIYFSGVSEIFYLNDTQEIIFKSPYAQIHSVHSNVDGLGVLYSQGNEQEIQFSFLSSELVASTPIILGKKLIDSEIKGNHMLVAVDQTIYDIDMISSKILGSYDIGKEILKVSFASAESIVVITAGGVNVLPIFKS